MSGLDPNDRLIMDLTAPPGSSLATHIDVVLGRNASLAECSCSETADVGDLAFFAVSADKVLDAAGDELDLQTLSPTAFAALVAVGATLALLAILSVPVAIYAVRRVRANRTRRRNASEWFKKVSHCIEQISLGDLHSAGIAAKDAKTVSELFYPAKTRKRGEALWSDLAQNILKRKANRCVTFVFTDLVDSTGMSVSNCEAFMEVQEIHDQIIRDAIDEFFGYEINTEGDSFQCAFHSASHALRFCLRVQEALLLHPWSAAVTGMPGMGKVASILHHTLYKGDLVIWRGPRVRMGMHTACEFGCEYEIAVNSTTGALQFSGQAFEMAERVESAAHGGQVLMTHSAVQRIRREALVFDVNMFHLGQFNLGDGAEAEALYQALPTKGVLAHRSFPQLAIPQDKPARGLNRIESPDEGASCFVCVRIDTSFHHSNRVRDSKGKLKRALQESGFLSSDSVMTRGGTAQASLDDFWSHMPRSVRGSLEGPLRSWMQQFGGYEVASQGSETLLVVFSEPVAALKFCMVAQLGTLLVDWGPDVLANRYMREEQDGNGNYLYRGPRLAMAVIRGGQGTYSQLKMRSSNVMDSSALSEGKGGEPHGEDGMGVDHALERSISLRWQHSYLMMKLVAPIFMPSKNLQVDDFVTNYKAWFERYPATGCSSLCGEEISPSNFLWKKTLVLFFYFSDKTHGCTMEAKYFRDLHTLFMAAGAEVIGVSLDGQETHAAKSESLQLPYPLISDRPGGLNAMFGGKVLLSRGTYVISKAGRLVSKYETFYDVITFRDPYAHAMHALSKAQELQRTTSGKQITYTGPSVELCNEVCDIVEGGQVVYIQENVHRSATDLWELLPSHGGKSRPCIVDLGTHRLAESNRVVSLIEVGPALLSGRGNKRVSLSDSTAELVHKGANDAPSAEGNVAIVFTFTCSLAEGQQEAVAEEGPVEAGRKQSMSGSSSGGTWKASSLRTSSVELPREWSSHFMSNASLFNSVPDSPRSKSQVKTFCDIARDELKACNGYESQEVGIGNFMMAFKTVQQAVEWCVKVQCLLQLKVPRSSRGFGVKMGVAFGRPTYGKPHSKSGRQDYFGPCINVAARVAKSAAPEQILIDAHGWKPEPFDATFEEGSSLRVTFCDAGVRAFKGFAEGRSVIQAIATPNKDKYYVEEGNNGSEEES